MRKTSSQPLVKESWWERCISPCPCRIRGCDYIARLCTKVRCHSWGYDEESHVVTFLYENATFQGIIVSIPVSWAHFITSASLGPKALLGEVDPFVLQGSLIPKKANSTYSFSFGSSFFSYHIFGMTFSWVSSDFVSYLKLSVRLSSPSWYRLMRDERTTLASEWKPF